MFYSGRIRGNMLGAAGGAVALVQADLLRLFRLRLAIHFIVVAYIQKYDLLFGDRYR